MESFIIIRRNLHPMEWNILEHKLNRMLYIRILYTLSICQSLYFYDNHHKIIELALGIKKLTLERAFVRDRKPSPIDSFCSSSTAFGS